MLHPVMELLMKPARSGFRRSAMAVLSAVVLIASAVPVLAQGTAKGPNASPQADSAGTGAGPKASPVAPSTNPGLAGQQSSSPASRTGMGRRGSPVGPSTEPGTPGPQGQHQNEK
jgi:hypothetical protein